MVEKINAIKQEVARILIGIGAVKFSPFDPFTYASGLKGPIYCDNRLLLSQVKERDFVILAFESLLNNLKGEYELLGGIATAGIPYAAFLADRLKCPMVYVRPKPKGHGKKNQVEGSYKDGQRLILFEDLINQGSSLEDAYFGVRDAKLICHHVLCVVDYEMKTAQEKMNSLGIKMNALTDFSTLIFSARELKLIDEDGMKLLWNWHADPVSWKPV